MLVEGFHRSTKLRLKYVKSAAFIPDKYPLSINDFTDCKLVPTDRCYFFAIAVESVFMVKVIGCARGVEVLIVKSCILDAPYHAFPLVEGINSVALLPERKELSGERVVVPPSIDADLQLKLLKEHQAAFNI